MKYPVTLAAAVLAGQAVAFPAAVFDAALKDPAVHAKAKRLNGISPGFSTDQFISTSGEYEWVAPGPTDQRGPCPGLNAFANHVSLRWSS